MSRTAFWVLLPFLLIFVGGMLWVAVFTGAINTAGGRIGIVGLCVIIGALGLAFYDSERFWWAGRFVAVFVFLVYAAYVLDEWFFTNHQWNYKWWSRSTMSPVRSVEGMITYGIPAFWYVFTGKFHRRADDDATHEYLADEEDDEDHLDEAGEEPDDRKYYERRNTP